MTNSYKDISPKNIHNYFIKRYKKNGKLEGHYFIKDSIVLDKCNNFLKLIRELEMSLDEKARIDKISELSNLTIELWGLLLKEALDALDSADEYPHTDTIKGISRLKQYLKKFKQFEMLIYGSNKWYRDTIYHQLWFYFVGEYLFSETNFNVMNALIDNKKKSWYCDPPPKKETDRDRVLSARYASFCVIALCHDLGKPLQIIHSINDAIRSMLKEYKFLHFNPFKVEFPLTYAKMLDFLVERLSQIGNPDREEETGSLKIEDFYEKETSPLNGNKKKIYYVKMDDYMDNQPHMQATFSTALAELNHGIISCLLLMESFRRFKGGAPYQKWKRFESGEKWIQKSYLTAQSILKSIVYHSIGNNLIKEIDLPYFWVCLVDDLTEWYRPTRAGKDFLSSSICKAKVKEASLQKIYVIYEFTQKVDQNEIDDHFIHFFIDKLERYYYMLEIDDFKFIIKVDIKIEGEKEGMSMEFAYHKQKDKEKPPKLKFKKKGKKCEAKVEVKELLMLNISDRIKKVKSIFE